MRTIAWAAVTLLCAGCVLPGSIPPARDGTASSSDIEGTMLAVARDVIAEVNQARRANGLKPMREDPALMRAAADHSAELAERHRLDHTSTNPARRTMTMRIDAAGGSWSRAAENLAHMSGSASDVPAQTVRLWLDSPGHRRNMLEPSYTHTGVGIGIDTRGSWYVTQLYVLPRTGR